LTSADIRRLARECGFELAGVAAAAPAEDRARYRQWLAAGFAGEMGYLSGARADARDHPRNLLPAARSVISVGKLYNRPLPYSTRFSAAERAWISRYAWSGDYHATVRRGLKKLEAALRAAADAPFASRILVDTAPLLERSYARLAGLGWIGKNTCLIHQGAGSWFFLGALLVSLEIGPDAPPPDRCGTCRRCIDACPTAALAPAPGGGGSMLDARRCIAYFTIELRGPIPERWRTEMGENVFGCDICQDVCPWNRRAPSTADPDFATRNFAPPLEKLAGLGESEFRALFGATPVARARYPGFLRNVAVAMGNSGLAEFRAPLERLAMSPDPMVAEHARWALGRLNERG
jgi:epoxyqueuosine reductase